MFCINPSCSIHSIFQVLSILPTVRLNAYDSQGSLPSWFLLPHGSWWNPGPVGRNPCNPLTSSRFWCLTQSGCRCPTGGLGPQVLPGGSSPLTPTPFAGCRGRQSSEGDLWLDVPQFRPQDLVVGATVFVLCMIPWRAWDLFHPYFCLALTDPSWDRLEHGSCPCCC